MAHISVKNASIEIPIHNGSASLKTALLRKAVGGRFGKVGRNMLVRALTGVSLEIKDGERVGLVGHNGSGKTTMLRMFAGVYPPTSGHVSVVGRVSPMLDISLGMSADATGIDNVRACGALWGLSPRRSRPA